MVLFVAIIHILTAILLITFVLIQDAKGGGAFGMGGSGGTNQILSSTGAANFLVNITRVLAVVFAATSIGLTYMTTSHSGSVTDDYVPAPVTGQPVAPAPGTPTAAAGAAAPAKDSAKDTGPAAGGTTTAPTPTEDAKSPSTPAANTPAEEKSGKQ